MFQAETFADINIFSIVRLSRPVTMPPIRNACRGGRSGCSARAGHAAGRSLLRNKKDFS